MKFTIITGPAITIECQACLEHVIGGTEPYLSASTGDLVEPPHIFSEDGGGLYCASCAAKLSAADPTRSVTRFYVDTTGEEIDHARLGPQD